MILNDVKSHSAQVAISESVAHDSSSVFLVIASYIFLYVFFTLCSLVLIAAGRAIYRFERRLTPFHVVLVLWVILLGFPISPLFGYKVVILNTIGVGTGFLSAFLCLILVAFAWVQFCKLVSISPKIKILSRRRGMEMRNSQAIHVATLVSVLAVLGFVVGLTLPVLV